MTTGTSVDFHDLTGEEVWNRRHLGIEITRYAFTWPGGVTAHIKQLAGALDRYNGKVQVLALPGDLGNSTAFDYSDIGTAALLYLHGTDAPFYGLQRPVVLSDSDEEDAGNVIGAVKEFSHAPMFAFADPDTSWSNSSSLEADAPEGGIGTSSRLQSRFEREAFSSHGALGEFAWRYIHDAGGQRGWWYDPDRVDYLLRDPSIVSDSLPLNFPMDPIFISLNYDAIIDAGFRVPIATGPAPLGLLGEFPGRSQKRLGDTSGIEPAMRPRVKDGDSHGVIYKILERSLAETRFAKNTLFEAVLHPLSTSVLDKRTGKVIERW